MAIIDIFTYNGEKEVLKLHLNIVDPYVDRFIIVEANQTFTGQPKPLHFFQQQRYFKPFWRKITYYVINQWEDKALWDIARNSPNTKGANHWKQEFYIKENIQKALKGSGVQDDDLVFVGDVDEIWEGSESGEEVTYPAKLKLDVYAYYLNNRSNEEFYGTYVNTYKDFKDKILNHERSRKDIRTKETHGWHFTSMGGLKEVQRKLDNSYTAESYNTTEVQSLLPQRHKQGIDYLGRNFQFNLDEKDWPTFLKENKKQFEHLCK